MRAAGGRVRAFTESEEDETDLFGADLIVDGLLGIGGRGGLREPYAALAAVADGAPAPVIAVDLPSGVDADTGEVVGHAVRADVTVTFGTYKPALFVDPAAERAGHIVLVDIGLTPELPGATVLCPRAVDIARLLPSPSVEDHKYSRGVLAVRAGVQEQHGHLLAVEGVVVARPAGSRAHSPDVGGNAGAAGAARPAVAGTSTRRSGA